MSEGYEVHLKEFSGPLDLLLHLVKQARLRIETIRLAEITDQYLTYMQEIDTVDLDRASDFLETASLLAYIKSRSLLPKPPAAEEDETDPEEELKERMRLYSLFKSMADSMREYQSEGMLYFHKLPEEWPVVEDRIQLDGVTAEMLCRTYAMLLAKEPKQPDPVHHVEVESFSVSEQKKRLLDRLLQGSFCFADFFPAGSSALAVAVTFLALLELWAAGRIKVFQEQPFGAIEIGEAGE